MIKTATVRIICMVLASLFAGFASSPARGDATATLDIDVNKPGHTIPKTFYGLMTEEINHAYDGGLFAELIQNRTFQDPVPRGRKPSADGLPIHWSLVGKGKAT